MALAGPAWGLEERMINLKHDARPAREKYGDPLVWTTKDGRSIPIREMGSVHLMNTVLYLERKCSDGELPWPTMQGEEAQYAAEREWLDEMAKPRFPPQYDTMLVVVKERGLERLLDLMRREKK